EKHSGSVTKYATWGLFLFVAIPLPGTGAWTGSLIAALLDMRMKKALPSVCGGVIVAGLLVSAISFGFLSFLDFLL
ncbi:MAG: small multi-drug export protein, partial [Clostridia bacterium]|nr:small multi-drug export protein [Clostridia bacterium]